ncbi:MAG: MmcQ/YjbR family DNA-binding protein [Actinomycetales bacterium]|nr:MmcQ/YjbR family DNA-binding protein [Actinomycetales bacterium]
MAHPTMFSDGDPYLWRVRAICLRFPEAEEFVSHGRPSFRTRKIFLTYGGGTKGAAGERIRFDHSIIIMPDDEERPALEEDERYYAPAYLAPYGWIALDLAHAGTRAEDVDWTEVHELVDSSYRRLAPRSLVQQLDVEGLRPPPPG